MSAKVVTVSDAEFEQTVLKSDQTGYAGFLGRMVSALQNAFAHR